MNRINGETQTVVDSQLESIKASLNDLESRTLEAGMPLVAYLIGAAAEAISDELVTKTETW